MLYDYICVYLMDVHPTEDPWSIVHFIYKAIYKFDIPYRTGNAPTSRMNVSDYKGFIWLYLYDYIWLYYYHEVYMIWFVHYPGTRGWIRLLGDDVTPAPTIQWCAAPTSSDVFAEDRYIFSHTIYKIRKSGLGIIRQHTSYMRSLLM